MKIQNDSIIDPFGYPSLTQETTKQPIVHCPMCRLIPSVKILSESELSIKCSKCNKEQIVSASNFIDGTTEFNQVINQKCCNYFEHGKKPSVRFCYDCQKFYCLPCLVTFHGIFENHQVIESCIPIKKNCDKHNARLTHYCLREKTEICMMCLFSDHKDHQSNEHVEMATLIDEKLKKKFGLLDEVKSNNGNNISRCFNILMSNYLQLQGDFNYNAINNIIINMKVIDELIIGRIKCIRCEGKGKVTKYYHCNNNYLLII